MAVADSSTAASGSVELAPGTPCLVSGSQIKPKCRLLLDAPSSGSGNCLPHADIVYHPLQAVSGARKLHHSVFSGSWPPESWE